MHLIKNNPFLTALIGITVVVCGALFYLGSKGADKYEEAKTEFDNAFNAVKKSEGIPLYPTAENRDAKKKALSDYNQSIDDLRALFDKYRKDDIENISTQEFTGRLKAANSEVTKALADAGCEVPEDFFMGFETYRDTLALTEATGLLDYQVEGLKHALLDLAKARPTELIKVFREKIPEESRGNANLPPGDVARQFGFEISFKGSENAAREFITSLGDTEPYYYIIRCMRIENEQDEPPTVSDAKFERQRAEAEEEPEDPFGIGFFNDAEEAEPAVDPEGAEPGVGEDEVAVVEEAPEPVDSSRILAQVLGAEEILVFVRFDLTLFLPKKELPKP